MVTKEDLKKVKIPKAKELTDRENRLAPGHRLCAGCTAGTIARLATLVTDPDDTVIFHATGCLEVATTIYPYTSWRLPWYHNAFENAAATASGAEAAYRAFVKKGKLDKIPDIITFAGDGGTYDIGLQSLSGALERGHDFVYICYTNGAYMNTGIQRSGGTPMYASTTTSPAGTEIPGKIRWRKDLVAIAAAHRVPYVATASPAAHRDLMTKVRRALDAEGPAFILVDMPCPRGWRFPESQGIKIAQQAIDCCYFPLYEIYDGREYELSSPSKVIALKPEKKIPVEEYLKGQGRFKHLFRPEKREDLIQNFQDAVDQEWAYLQKMVDMD
ncbi:MAG: thiamine pyrophosphate-dependent enzyme [Asgard group archaeon]|nr:thiamine pyrophosphate-dependent enzyme [Asgard group archaeon]